MQKKLTLAIFTLSYALFTHSTLAQPPTNITCAKKAVIAYYTSGEYEKDVSATIKNAEWYLQKRVAENRLRREPHKLAMILDIDDTSLSNFEGNKKRDFSGLNEGIEASYREANAAPINSTLALYKEAINEGVAVFFITFRPDKFRNETISNLQKVGYYGWSNLYLPNEKEVKQPSAKFKTYTREMITQQGYDIILNLGDQDSDLVGGYAEHIEKLPNPLYSTSPNCNEKSC